MNGNRRVEMRLGALLRSGVGVLPILAVAGLMCLNPASLLAWAASPQVQAAYPVTVTLIPNPRTDLTFARDVAPIIQQNCENCHRPGNVSPMVLQTYQQVRRYATRVRDRVIRRQMPPWPIDRTVGITEFKNDPSLSDEEIRTIVDWIDSGAPLGDPADLPEPMVWPDGNDWSFEADLGPPDMVLQSPIYNVVANGDGPVAHADHAARGGADRRTASHPGSVDQGRRSPTAQRRGSLRLPPRQPRPHHARGDGGSE